MSNKLYFIIFFLPCKKNWELLKELVRTKFYKSYEMTLNFLSLGESRDSEGEMDILEDCLGPAYDFLH